MTEAETEAEALLRSGALYPERSGLRSPGGRLSFVGSKHGAVSIYFGNDPSYHLDLEGRWLRCFVAPSHFLRRFDGSTQAIDRPRVDGRMVLDRRVLDEAEAARLDESVRGMALDLDRRISSGELEFVPPPEPSRAFPVDAIRAFLARAARWDADRWAEHRRRIASTYHGLPTPPPDGQDALILQATAPPGPGLPRYARSPDEFYAHCLAVSDLLGLGLVPYRTLFLDGPDVLRRSPDEAEAYLRIATAVFPLAETPAPARLSELPVDRPHRDGIHARVGRSGGPPPDPSSWPRLGAAGLRRVTFGLTVGDAPDPGDLATPPEELPDLIRGARAAGIPVSLDARIGPSTPDDRAGAADRIRALGLGKGDHVYLIDDDRHPDAVASLLADLAPLRKASGAKVLPYSLRKQGI